jgi:hypothetical protein
LIHTYTLAHTLTHIDAKAVVPINGPLLTGTFLFEFLDFGHGLGVGFDHSQSTLIGLNLGGRKVLNVANGLGVEFLSTPVTSASIHYELMMVWW